MKAFVAACVVFAVVTALSFCGSGALSRCEHNVELYCERALKFAQDGDWQSAKQMTESAEECWHRTRPVASLFVFERTLTACDACWDKVRFAVEGRDVALLAHETQNAVREVRYVAKCEKFEWENVL